MVVVVIVLVVVVVVTTFNISCSLGHEYYLFVGYPVVSHVINIIFHMICRYILCTYSLNAA